MESFDCLLSVFWLSQVIIYAPSYKICIVFCTKWTRGWIIIIRKRITTMLKISLSLRRISNSRQLRFIHAGEKRMIQKRLSREPEHGFPHKTSLQEIPCLLWNPTWNFGQYALIAYNPQKLLCIQLFLSIPRRFPNKHFTHHTPKSPNIRFWVLHTLNHSFNCHGEFYSGVVAVISFSLSNQLTLSISKFHRLGILGIWFSFDLRGRRSP